MNTTESGVLAYQAYNPGQANDFLYKASRFERDLDLSSLGLSLSVNRNSVFGFGANVYGKENYKEIVISFRGAEPAKTLGFDLISDVSLAFSVGIPQVIEAVKLYVDVIKKYPDSYDQITFTGHSLGGGLAGIMSLMFVQDAHLYAPAPFGFSMFNPVTFATIKTTFESARIGASPEASAKLDLARNALDSFIIESVTGDYSQDRRNAIRSVHAVKGEFLSDGIVDWMTRGIVRDNSVLNRYDVGSHAELGALPSVNVLHSMSLHLACQLSPQNFVSACVDVPELLSTLFLGGYYEVQPTEPEVTALAPIIRAHLRETNFGDNAGVVGALDRYAEDIHRIKDLGNSAGDGDALVKGLIALATQYHVEQAAGVSGQFFSVTNGVVSFDLSVLKDIRMALREPSRFLGFFGKRTGDLWQFINGQAQGASLQGLDRWYVSSDKTKPLLVTGTADGDVLVGSPVDGQGDNLDGAGGNDLLVGQSGADWLTGGTGDDQLYGGTGHDVYVFASGHGVDRIHDADTSGSIEVDGTFLAGGVSTWSPGTRLKSWIDGNGVEYVFQSRHRDPDTDQQRGTLTIFTAGRGDPGNRIIIDDWTLYAGEERGDFGLTFVDRPRLTAASGVVTVNPFAGVGYAPPDNATLSLAEGAGSQLTLAVNGVADHDRTVSLSVPGSAGLVVTLGDSRHLLDAGPVDITIPAGQSMVVVGLSQEGDVDGALAPLALQAALVDGDATATHAMTLNIGGVTEDDAAPVAVSAIGYGDFSTSTHGIRIDGVPTVLGSAYRDVVTGVGSAGQVVGLGGDDALFVGAEVAEAALLATEPAAGVAAGALLSGAQGNDLAVGAEGADTLLGGGEQDRLYGQAGADLLLGDFVVGVDGAVALERRQSTFLDADNAAHAVLDRGAWQIAVGFSGGGWDAGACREI